ncbi:sensor histidine kinase [Streptomyces nitrosporeus]|uniref:histidine kinase n=1 Tax=Streptomyces nitrosporeus TaxID=28894 RepID=A0A5J6FIV4_9ACTN|nr:sensor histidine kinase [Streptomyces nitrosporeus]QEU74850.1 sensor histidine kinase [Streptomyces nitrosporeus]GGZ26850.1 two-component sensor histidine kinase [Streptomyces nitrosporeus]
MTTLPTGFARARRWLRGHPLAFDGALAAGVLVCMVCASFAEPHPGHGPSFGVRAPDTSSVLLMVLGAAALVRRRSRPMEVLAATGALSIAEFLLSDPPAPVVMSVVVALYTVAARTDRPTTWRVGLLTMVSLTMAAMVVGSSPWYSQENVGVLAWLGLAGATGDAVRSRRAFVDAIRERAERAERTREEEARRRVAEERLRIARDLHDVVAHHIALVNVQAGVAAHVMDKRPDQAKEALAHVRQASRSALDELRSTVGLLRQSGDPEAPTEPAPGLAVLDDLVATFRNAGLPVEVARTDRDEPLPAAVDLAAYRIIQEALTNVRKHAGAHARAEVSVVRAGASAEVTVLDDGTGTAAGADRADGGGHGLLGMRERVTALGGALTAGPRYGGGFRVHAILPLTTGADGEPARDTGQRAGGCVLRAAPGDSRTSTTGERV